MTIYRHNDKEFIDRIERIDITDYVQTFLLGFKKNHGVALKINNFGTAEYLKSLLNSSQNRVCLPLESLNGFFYWNSQKVDFVSSNLSKGYIFYFACSYCDKRVKYLYQYRTYDEPSCRTCCKFGYVPHLKRTSDFYCH